MRGRNSAEKLDVNGKLDVQRVGWEGVEPERTVQWRREAWHFDAIAEPEAKTCPHTAAGTLSSHCDSGRGRDTHGRS